MNDPRGSLWRKWDLHVHTPESIVHHYPSVNSDPWEPFLRNLEQLPPEFREVITLRELEDCSYKEIAEIANVPVGTVMSRLARARTQLGQILSKIFKEGV